MTTKAVDAIPAEVQNKFLSLAKAKSSFWHDMFSLCNAFGLRNIEARELKASQVDLERGIITLDDAKQRRAHITKQSNKAVDAEWLIEGRKWLRHNVDDPNISLIVRIATDTKGLANLADEYDLLNEFTTAKNTHYLERINQARELAAKTAPKGRTIDFKRNLEAKRILSNRVAKYGNLCNYLFPSCELNSNRATEYAPVTRQAVYRVIKGIREQIESLGGMFKRALDGIRTGLHSMRKSFVQRVVDVMGGDILAGSMAVGHGNGQGDIATTQKYLNRSQKRMNEINARLAEL